jgi:hypothetical protein
MLSVAEIGKAIHLSQHIARVETAYEFFAIGWRV